MDTLTFDAVTRRVARARTRRSALGLVAGAVLASAVHRVAACEPGHDCRDRKGGKGGKGGKDDKKKDKKDEKRCRKHAQACLGFFYSYCEKTYLHIDDDTNIYVECKAAYSRCCGHYKDCDEGTGDTCVQAIPY